jgi:hypothetical protein
MSMTTTNAPPGRSPARLRLAFVSETTTAATPPRPKKLLLTRREAAAMLGMSLSHFQRHVQPRIPCVYSGQLRLYRPLDLERWVEHEVEVSERGELHVG